MLPVLNIPTSPYKGRYKGDSGASLAAAPTSGFPPAPAAASTSSSGAGHPGLPNGLLRMANMQQSGHPPPKIATKIVPKDLKSQLALSKIGLLEGGHISKPPSIMSSGRKVRKLNEFGTLSEPWWRFNCIKTA